jgi:hypothetical protein
VKTYARSARPIREPLPAYARQRLDGWIRMLDVDLDQAQRMLRLPALQLPVPPIALPAVVDHEGRVLAPAVEAHDAATDGPLEEPVADAPKVPLRGAYARRASR